MDQPQILEFLKQNNLRNLLSATAIEALSKRIKVKDYPPDSLLFSEGDSFHGFYLVVEGTVKLVRYRADGREMLIHFAQEGNAFAEAAVFLKKYPVTGISDSKCKLLLITPNVIEETMATEPKFWQFLFQSMAGWLERLIQKIDTLIQNDAVSRLVRFLLEEVKSDEHGKRSVELKFKKGDLATMLNMNQATLSRTFRKLQEDGWIDVHARHILLRNETELKKLLLPPLD